LSNLHSPDSEVPPFRSTIGERNILASKSPESIHAGSTSDWAFSLGPPVSDARRDYPSGIRRSCESPNGDRRGGEPCDGIGRQECQELRPPVADLRRQVDTDATVTTESQMIGAGLYHDEYIPAMRSFETYQNFCISLIDDSVIDDFSPVRVGLLEAKLK
jgi:hypothetical protein